MLLASVFAIPAVLTLNPFLFIWPLAILWMVFGAVSRNHLLIKIEMALDETHSWQRYGLWVFVHRGQPLPAEEIASSLHVSKELAARFMADLLKVGCLSVVSFPDDTKYLAMTAHGWLLADRVDLKIESRTTSSDPRDN